MTEQELLKEIRGIIYIWRNEDTRQGGQDVSELAVRFLALIKEALPELAKEAGYVRLAKDQTLPDINLPTLTGNKSLEFAMESFAKSIQQNLFKEGWRRIILEVKDGS